MFTSKILIIYEHIFSFAASKSYETLRKAHVKIKQVMSKIIDAVD